MTSGVRGQVWTVGQVAYRIAGRQHGTLANERRPRNAQSQCSTVDRAGLIDCDLYLFERDCTTLAPARMVGSDARLRREALPVLLREAGGTVGIHQQSLQRAVELPEIVRPGLTLQALDQ